MKYTMKFKIQEYRKKKKLKSTSKTNLKILVNEKLTKLVILKFDDLISTFEPNDVFYF
jgi:hypothetical protein